MNTVSLVKSQLHKQLCSTSFQFFTADGLRIYLVWFFRYDGSNITKCKQDQLVYSNIS